MTATAETQSRDIANTRTILSQPILTVDGSDTISIAAGTTVGIDGKMHEFPDRTPVAMGALSPGHDYGVTLDADGNPVATIVEADPIDAGCFAGFHFAPGGNAEQNGGGTVTPAINPASVWDLDFRPACDPRGMALVPLVGGGGVWVDIYLLGRDHLSGTSRCGASIADGRTPPDRIDGKCPVKKLDYATAVGIYASHGKRLLGAEEFFAAAYGVEERCSRDAEPDVTGAISDRSQRFISRSGIFDVTGTMWQWGTDGHPDDPRPSLFGGSWLHGSDAGSRYANLDYWPEGSDGSLSARGACDHL